jgi:superfamily II DNA or RNA helicase
MITANIENIYTTLQGFVSPALKEKISDELSFKIQDAEFAIQAITQRSRLSLEKKHGAAAQLMKIPPVWDGRQRFFFKKTNKFPTGLISRAVKVLNAQGHEVFVVDKRIKPPTTLDLHLTGLNPHDFQSRICQAAVNAQRGIVRLATGGGKTEVMAMLLTNLNRNAVILIHRETIFQQLIERLSRRLGIKIGAVGGGVYDPSDITVAMVQTVTQPKFQGFMQSFPVVIADECHHTPAKTIYDVLQSCTGAYYRYGFTATPWRDDNAEMFTEAAFGKFISDIGPSELIRSGHLTKPKVSFIETDFNPRWNLLSWPGQYAQCVVENEMRNNLIVDVAHQFKIRRKTSLIAVTQIRHGKHLLSMIKKKYPDIRVKFIQGEDESEEKQLTLRQLGARELDVVIATSVFGEGIDVPSLDAIINAKAQDSRVDTMQLIGRALRIFKGKETSYFVDFMDKQSYTKRHSQKRFGIFDSESDYEVYSTKTMSEFISKTF